MGYKSIADSEDFLFNFRNGLIFFGGAGEPFLQTVCHARPYFKNFLDFFVLRCYLYKLELLYDYYYCNKRYATTQQLNNSTRRGDRQKELIVLLLVRGL